MGYYGRQGHVLSTLAERGAAISPHHRRCWYSDLYDERFEQVQFGSLQDGAEGHDGGVAVTPVGMFDVLLDEGQDVRDHVVFTAGGQQHQTHPRRLAGIPVIIIVVLVLRTPGPKVRDRS